MQYFWVIPFLDGGFHLRFEQQCAMVVNMPIMLIVDRNILLHGEIVQNFRYSISGAVKTIGFEWPKQITEK